MKKKIGPSSTPPSVRPNGRTERIYINLGRTGDAIASVPLCYIYWKETGKKAALMVAREFAGFLRGISYIEPEIWPGDWRDVLGAKARARMLGYKDIIIPQVYGYDWPVHHTQPSFLLESWNRVGQLDKFYTTPLVFDKRNHQREKLMIDRLPKGLPVVLVAADGTSSPFKHRDELMADLNAHLIGRANVVDLKDYRTDHFYDFIGMFEQAACLVTIDTGFGQLACAAPSMPVVALAASEPGKWYSSPRRPQHVAYVRYNDYPSQKQEVLDALDRCVGSVAKVPIIHHVWAGVYHPSQALTRQVIAKETWDREAKDYGHWRDCRFTDEQAKRSAIDLGETVALPFLHDMIDAASEKAEDDDVIMLTNADICLVTGLGKELVDACKLHGSTYCHRWDFKRVLTHIERHQLVMGSWYVGCDAFAFTKKWWMKNRDNLPPFVLGRECWDWVFRELIKQTGGVETKKGIYHEKHASPWEVHRELAGNLHNRSYARAWLKQAKIPLAEIENEPYLEVLWNPTNKKSEI